jgi:hypothetical protein
VCTERSVDFFGKRMNCVDIRELVSRHQNRASDIRQDVKISGINPAEDRHHVHTSIQYGTDCSHPGPTPGHDFRIALCSVPH